MPQSLVPALQVRRVITASLEPVVSEMVHVRDDVWTQVLSDGLRSVVTIRALKGAQYVVTYGVCCAWVPFRHGSRRPGGRPRTLEQTTLHLWVDHHTQNAQSQQWVTALDGEQAVRAQARRAGKEVADRAPVWWQQAATPAGVVAEARRQAENAFDIHSPRAREVLAFTLAYLGDLQSAKAELEAAGGDERLLALLVQAQ